jgi:hypothetical protein
VPKVAKMLDVRNDDPSLMKCMSKPRTASQTTLNWRFLVVGFLKHSTVFEKQGYCKSVAGVNLIGRRA